MNFTCYNIPISTWKWKGGNDVQIDATASEFKNFLKVITFSNRNDSALAKQFYLSKGYLWRRDEHRLCALELPEFHFQDAFEYPFGELEEQMAGASTLSIEDSGRIHVQTLAQNQSWITATPFSTTNKPLDVLSMTHEQDMTFQLPSSFLSKQLSMFQTKIRKADLDVDNIVLSFDFETKEMFISSHQKERISLPLEETLGQLPKQIVQYSFSHFKDFLANSNKFDDFISFRIHYPYYTVIKLSKHVHTVLMHKKE